MRFSHYNILSDQTKSGEYVLLNGLSGLSDLIDKEIFDLIAAYQEADELPPEVFSHMGELGEHFLNRGYLTQLRYEEELAKAEATAQTLFNAYAKGGWDVTLVPSLSCNYRCTYCFEKPTGYPALKMSTKQVDAVFEGIKDNTGTGETLSLYGGEPLAKENRELIEYIVGKGKATGRTFFAVTNAHDLAYYMDLIGSSSISTLQITVDGPKRIHDSRRIALDGESSYDRILGNIDAVLRKTDASVNLRINLDKRNMPHILELLGELERRGILDHQNLHIAASPVVGIGSLGLAPEDILTFEKAVEEKYPQMKDNLYSRTRSNNVTVLSPLCLGQKVSLKGAGCGAACNSKVFTPDGLIYSCWGCLGQPDQAIAAYDEEGHIRWNEEKLAAWMRIAPAYNSECLACRYAFLCGGGCRRPALPGESSAHSYDCEYYRHLFGRYLARVAEHI